MSRRPKSAPSTPNNGSSATPAADPLALTDAPPQVDAFVPIFSKFKRSGGITDTEQALIDRFVADQPREISTDQVKALAKVLRRRPSTVRDCIQRARENFVATAEGYVEVHQQAVEGALSRRDFDTAAKHAEWALEHLSHEGQRVVDRDVAETHVPKIIIGVALGGMGLPTATEPTVTATLLNAHDDDIPDPA